MSTTFSNKATAQEGKTIFNTYCAACHKMDKDLTGPALLGVEERWGNDRKKLVAWVKNSANLIASGDKHANEIFAKWNKLPMTPFESILKDAEIDAVLDYIKDWKPAVAATTPGQGEQQPSKFKGLIIFLGIATSILVVMAIFLFFRLQTLKGMSQRGGQLRSDDAHLSPNDGH